jgi:hypothetical protein
MLDSNWNKATEEEKRKFRLKYRLEFVSASPRPAA